MTNETINNTTNHYAAPNTEAGVEIMREGLSVARAYSADMREASQEAIAEREKASKARVDTFSNDKGRMMNKQYEDYLAGSIAENFETVVQLTKQKTALMEEATATRIQLTREKAEAQIELDKIKKETMHLKLSKAKLWVWRILWPALGVVLGILVNLLLK